MELYAIVTDGLDRVCWTEVKHKSLSTPTDVSNPGPHGYEIKSLAITPELRL